MSQPALFEIITLKSGTKSLRSLASGETFHPGIGPVEEARLLHVEQGRLKERAAQLGRFVLWDVGFGAAANALAALEALEEMPGPIEIHSFDQTTAPIDFALGECAALPYLARHRERIEQLMREGRVQIGHNLRWHFHLGDFREVMEDGALPAPDGILYDPYSPAKNSEMWSLPHFCRLRARCGADCLLTSYSRSTAVRVTLLLAGFYVGIGRVLGEKAETTVAASRLSSLERPLARDWLERVKVSRNAAPFRLAEYANRPIVAEDLAEKSSGTRNLPERRLSAWRPRAARRSWLLAFPR